MKKVPERKREYYDMIKFQDTVKQGDKIQFTYCADGQYAHSIVEFVSFKRCQNQGNRTGYSGATCTDCAGRIEYYKMEAMVSSNTAGNRLFVKCARHGIDVKTKMVQIACKIVEQNYLNEDLFEI